MLFRSLEVALNSKSFGIGKQQDILANLGAIVNDKNFPMNDATRKKMATAVSIMNAAVEAISPDSVAVDSFDFTGFKQQKKEETLAAIRALGGATGKNAPGDPVIAEALRAVFTPILNYYVRTPMKAVG